MWLLRCGLGLLGPLALVWAIACAAMLLAGVVRRVRFLMRPRCPLCLGRGWRSHPTYAHKAGAVPRVSRPGAAVTPADLWCST